MDACDHDFPEYASYKPCSLKETLHPAIKTEAEVLPLPFISAVFWFSGNY
jgi:hypothetical protein